VNLFLRCHPSQPFLDPTAHRPERRRTQIEFVRVGYGSVDVRDDHGVRLMVRLSVRGHEGKATRTSTTVHAAAPVVASPGSSTSSRPVGCRNVKGG